ncbi:CdaR family protein [Pseudobdellovibrio sp. HCB154]|uniref:CdaR family protein n=1 Tax=Pseudobdellovibrio sp. HCB154 TaxID=3386277 RepID=UPI0039172AF4
MKPQIDRAQVLKSFFFDNLSYKVVSLFVALILWISILGRRDFVTTKEMSVQLVLPPGYMVVGQSHDKLRVKISGAQPVLKKYKDSFKKVVFDLSDSGEGLVEIDVPNNRIDVPEGVKVLNVKPNVIRVEIAKIKN